MLPVTWLYRVRLFGCELPPPSLGSSKPEEKSKVAALGAPIEPCKLNETLLVNALMQAEITSVESMTEKRRAIEALRFMPFVAIRSEKVGSPAVNLSLK